jgi:hypothetical protein
VATTWSEVATQIQRESYAIYRVDDDTHQAVQEAWHQARAFFSSIHGNNNTGDTDDRQEELERRTGTNKVIQDGHLMGFHIPSPAKYLFRAYCDMNDQHTNRNVGKKDPQPWPSESFRIASCRLARKLDGILNQCCSEIRAQITEPQTKDTDTDTNTNTTTHTNTAGTKKRKWAGQSQSESESESNSDSSNNNIRLRRPAHNNNHCPLDYFLYHGSADPAARVSNCTAHVDRGFLIAICLTHNSPGLEVLPTATSNSNTNKQTAIDYPQYVCPEDSTQRASLFTEATSCTNLLCILAGDQWRQLDPDTAVQACVHRVRSNLRTSRLSISYELRM